MGRRPDEYPGAADAAVVRSLNRAAVLDAIRVDGPSSRSGLARSLALSKPTVSSIVEGLLAEGLVREHVAGQGRRRPRIGRAGGGDAGAGTGGPGRPPVVLTFNERSSYVLGIHVGVRWTTVVLADAAGGEQGRRVLETPRVPAETALVEVGAIAREVVVGAGIPRRRLAAVGVCVPGSVDVDAGTCVHAPALGWRDAPVAAALAAALGVPAIVRSGVQAAALAESVEGSARGARTMALVHAGTGVGAAVVEDGRLLGGAHGMAGELGHALVPGLDARCACGRHGCVETAASAPAIARAARDAVRAGTPTRLAPLGEGITSLDVYAAAEAGDTLAQALLGEAGRTLGIAASWLVNLADPEVLVIGGGLVGAGRHLVDPFRAALEGAASRDVLDRLAVRTWSLEQDAKVRGAVLLALARTRVAPRLVRSERVAAG